MSLLEESIAAHGGMEAWRSLDALRLTVRAGGLAFASRGQNRIFDGVAATVATRGQHVVFEGIDGGRGTWTGGETTIERGGEVVARTERPSLRPRWRMVDAVAFGAAALWTYVSFPFVLVDEAIDVTELSGRRLRVSLRAPLVAHARQHVLHVGENGLIRRQDYTAEAFGPLARAANVVLEHGELGGITTGVRRLVTPRLLGRPLPGPALVRIEFSREYPGSGALGLV